MRSKRALICGISGQDGAYLSELLLKKGYQVIGTSRDPRSQSFKNLQRLGIREQISIRPMSLANFHDVSNIVSEVEPGEIYNLAGQSSVALSFEHPRETMESVCMGTLNLLEAVRVAGNKIKFFNSGSSECFGDTGDKSVDETSAFHPKSPYAIAKSAACWQVANYREAYDLFVCNGIMFNHESPMRPAGFVTKKIVSTACAIRAGDQTRLKLGNIDVERDWGWAPEYCEAMWKILQHEIPEDFVIATGETNSLKEFTKITFQELDLDWQEHVDLNPSLCRPTDIKRGVANPQKAHNTLGWRAKNKMRDVIQKLIEAELQEKENSLGC